MDINDINILELMSDIDLYIELDDFDYYFDVSSNNPEEQDNE